MTTTPNKHAELIRAWTAGAQIQLMDINEGWIDIKSPEWRQNREYRVKPAPAPMTNTAPEFLHRAATIMEERGKQYDKPGGERSMGKTVAAFNAITGQDLTIEQGWQFMMVLKAVRFFSNTTAPHRDSLEDAIAYSALLAESAMKGDGHV